MAVEPGPIDVHHYLIPPGFEGKPFRERRQRVAVHAIGKALDRGRTR